MLGWTSVYAVLTYMHCERVIFLKYHAEVCLILITCRVVLVKEIKTSRTVLYKLPHLFSFSLFSLSLSNLMYFILGLEAGNEWPCCWVPWGFGVFCQQHEVCLFSSCLSLKTPVFLNVLRVLLYRPWPSTSLQDPHTGTAANQKWLLTNIYSVNKSRWMLTLDISVGSFWHTQADKEKAASPFHVWWPLFSTKQKFKNYF